MTHLRFENLIKCVFNNRNIDIFTLWSGEGSGAVFTLVNTVMMLWPLGRSPQSVW